MSQNYIKIGIYGQKDCQQLGHFGATGWHARSVALLVYGAVGFLGEQKMPPTSCEAGATDDNQQKEELHVVRDTFRGMGLFGIEE